MSARSSNGRVTHRAKDRLAQDRKRDTGIAESQRKKHEAAIEKMQRLRALRLAKEAADKLAAQSAADIAAQERVKARKGAAGS